MNYTWKRRSMSALRYPEFLNLIFLFLIPTFLSPSFSLASQEECSQNFTDHGNDDEKQSLQHFVFDPDSSFAFKGLTDKGRQHFKEIRDKLRRRDRLFSINFFGQDNIHRAITAARIAKHNVFLQGPGGGAKTQIGEWFAQGEAGKVFKPQLNPMTSEQALIGGMRLDEATKGRYVINTEGSIADNVQFALLDELHLASPPVLTVLKSILNERKIFLGQTEIQIPLETVVATSNAYLSEIYTYFENSGHGPSSSAFFNRFQIKAILYNWLPPHLRAELIQREMERRNHLELLKIYPELKNRFPELQKPEPIDWKFLHSLSELWFKFDGLFLASFNELLSKSRMQTHEAIKTSRAAKRKLESYTPSFEYSDRIVLQTLSLIKTSALLDFMLSPLADDVNLGLLDKPMELDQISIWRAHFAMTTVGPGTAGLQYSTKEDSSKTNLGLSLVLDLNKSPDTNGTQVIDLQSLRDEREEQFLNDIRGEQERFSKIYNEINENIQRQFELRARSSLRPKPYLGPNESFEILLLNSSPLFGEKELVQKDK